MKLHIISLLFTFLGFCLSLHGQQESYLKGFEQVRTRVLSENKEVLKKIAPIVDKLDEKGFSSDEILSYISFSQFLHDKYNEDPGKIYPVWVEQLNENPISKELSDAELGILMESKMSDFFFIKHHININYPYELHSTQEVIDVIVKAEIKDGDNVFLFYDGHLYGEILFHSDRNLNIINYHPSLEAKVLENNKNRFEMICHYKIGKGHYDFDVAFITFAGTPSGVSNKNLKRLYNLLKPDANLLLGGPYSTDGPMSDNTIYDGAAKRMVKKGFELIEKTNPNPENVLYHLKKRI